MSAAPDTEWHRVITFQIGLIDMFEKHAKKGRLVYISGKLQTRKWRKDGEDSDRTTTEIVLVPGSTVRFLHKQNGTNGNPSEAPGSWPGPPSATQGSLRWLSPLALSAGSLRWLSPLPNPDNHDMIGGTK